jgi:hypothetical protein
VHTTRIDPLIEEGTFRGLYIDMMIFDLLWSNPAIIVHSNDSQAFIRLRSYMLIFTFFG